MCVLRVLDWCGARTPESDPGTEASPPLKTCVRFLQLRLLTAGPAEGQEILQKCSGSQFPCTRTVSCGTHGALTGALRTSLHVWEPPQGRPPWGSSVSILHHTVFPLMMSYLRGAEFSAVATVNKQVLCEHAVELQKRVWVSGSEVI